MRKVYGELNRIDSIEYGLLQALSNSMFQKPRYQSYRSDSENGFHSPQYPFSQESYRQSSASFDVMVVLALIGKYSVLLYKTKLSQDLVYLFMHRRGNRNGTEVYVRFSCKKLKKRGKSNCFSVDVSRKFILRYFDSVVGYLFRIPI